VPVFEVDVKAVVEAADEVDAIALALGDEPRAPGRWILGRSCAALEVAELSPDRAAEVLELAAELNMALSFPGESYAEDPDHPGVRFSPAAAATMRRLRGGA